MTIQCPMDAVLLYLKMVGYFFFYESWCQFCRKPPSIRSMDHFHLLSQMRVFMSKSMGDSFHIRGLPLSITTHTGVLVLAFQP